MELQQAANEAMAYLDSVGVAAEYEIRMYDYKTDQLMVFTDDYITGTHSSMPDDSIRMFIDNIKEQYPQKSPA